MLNVNHVTSKKIVNLPSDVTAVEYLESVRMRRRGNGKRFNGKIGSWSPFQLEQFMEYRAEDPGKSVIYVDPGFTSQKCSRCGYISRNRRKCPSFHCTECGFQLHADLNQIPGDVSTLESEASVGEIKEAIEKFRKELGSTENY